LLTAIAMVLISSCSGSPSEIAMTDAFRFEPGTLSVEAGTTVTFVNDSDQSHTATAYSEEVPEGAFFSSGGFGSEAEARDELAGALVSPGESFEVTLDAPGAYRYYCIPHEDQGMKGTIEIE
jgi:plastocyanin